MEIKITQGWTGPVDVQLLADGVPVNLAGCTVAIILTDRTGAAVTPVGTVAAFDEAAGKVRYSPDEDDLTSSKSPYRVRFQVTDAGQKHSYFPSGVGGTVRVYAQ